MCFHVRQLPQDGFLLCTGVVGPFLMLCLVLSYVISCTHAWRFLHGKDVDCECRLLQHLLEKDYGLLDNGLCRFDIRFVDDLHFSDPYTLGSIHLNGGCVFIYVSLQIYLPFILEYLRN